MPDAISDRLNRATSHTSCRERKSSSRTAFPGPVVSCLLLGPFLGLIAACGGLAEEAPASGTEANASPSITDGAPATEITLPAPVARRDRPRPQSISEEDWTAIRALPPARSGADEVLFPPGDDNLMEPIVGTKEFSDEALEINPYELMPRDKPITDEHRAEIYELLVEMQPLREDLTSDHHDRQYILNLRRLEAILSDDRPEVGWAALHAFTNYKGENFQHRRTLLKIGAVLSPDEASTLFEQLAFTYGYRMGDRAEAVLLLAETDPDALLEGALPYLQRRTGKRHQTAPSDEFYVRAWAKACEVSGRDAVPMMADAAMNIALEPIARYTAVEELAKHGDNPLARATLQEALIESTGDGYLRRKAAQGIIASFPGEDACSVLMKVYRNEADQNMARFLDDMIQTNCR